MRHAWALSLIGVVLWVETEEMLPGKDKSTLWTQNQTWPNANACERAKVDAIKMKSLGWSGPEVEKISTEADTYVSVHFKGGGSLTLTYRCLPEGENPKLPEQVGVPADQQVAPPTEK